MSKYEFKGTPGDWLLENNVVFSESEGFVCACTNGPHTECYDAQAISAVPELIKTLASLTATLDAIGGTPGTMTASAWRDFECDKKLAEAHSVLAKATGYNGTTEQ